MAQDPLHVLWVEPHFPGRLGAVADWLVRRRGYRCWFYCHTADPREHWPASVGQGLELQVFGVGGVAREQAVAWSRTLERSLCYAYGCWEVLESRRPRPIDLIVGRSAGLGSTLFAPVYAPAPPRDQPVRLLLPPRSRTTWPRRPAAASLPHTFTGDDRPTPLTCLTWSSATWPGRRLTGSATSFPREYRDDFWVQHDGIDVMPPGTGSRSWDPPQTGRSIAGRIVPDRARVVSFVGRSLDRLRGFDRFWHAANVLLRDRSDVICVIVGDPVVQRGLDIQYHNRDYAAHLRKSAPPVDPDRIWFLGRVTPGVVGEVFAATDLHVAPGRPYPVARSLLEAMARGCIVLASDTAPHREVISHGQTGLLADAANPDELFARRWRYSTDPAQHQPLGDAAAELVRSRYTRDVCLPQLAERFSKLAATRRKG